MAIACGASASAAAPQVEYAAPAVGQQGTEFSLRVVGAGLADAQEIMLYSPCVTSVALTAASDNEASFQLRASADCPPGSHAFRVRTRKGLSELHTFRVTSLPVVIEEEPNNAPSEAQLVDANVTIAGVIESGDVDSFRITLRRGQRLAAEVEAIRLGSTMLDTVLSVYGPNGKQIVAVDDTPLFRQDPFLTMLAPEDGQYIVQVRESNYGGDERSRYALHLGSFPRPAFVYPAGGPAGQSLRVRFGGDAMGAFEHEVRLPDSAAASFGVFAEHQGLTAPTPNPFRVSPFDNVLEQEPNDDPAGAGTAVSELPIAFNGVLQQAGDVDCFRFSALQDAVFQFETFASRIGSPMDSVIWIVDADGNRIVANDDDGSHDSRLVFAAPQTGQYVLGITDKRGEGGANFVYRIEASQPGSGIVAFLPRPDRKSQERQTIVVPRGNRVMAILGVRRTGLEGDVQLSAEDVPSGVSFSPCSVDADRFTAPVVVAAAADAPLAGALAPIRARLSSDGHDATGGFAQVVDLVAGTADALFQSIEVDRLAIAVVDEYPYSISLDAPATPLPRDGTIGFQVRAERRDGFDGPLQISFPCLPPWVDGPDSITIPAGQSSAVYTARSFEQAEPRAWPLCAVATPGRDGPRITTDGLGNPTYPRGRAKRSDGVPATAVASEMVTLAVADSPVTGTIGTVAAEQGQELRVVCQIKRRGPLPASMKAVLEGLPNRVSAESVAVAESDTTVAFTVKLEPTAPVGSFPSLVCRLSGTIAEQEVSYCIGRGALLKIQPAGGLVVDETGRPLSALEALRQSKRKDKDKVPSPSTGE
jgi:hypothetical protein